MKMAKPAVLAAMMIGIVGCGSFGPPPDSFGATDAGVMPGDDAGERPRAEHDGGMQMPPEVDAGEPLGDVPASGSPCDPDRDRETYDCALAGCTNTLLVCLGDGRWRCVADQLSVCVPTPSPDTDAGTPAPVDAGTDSGPPPVDAGTDSGTPDAGHDAGTDAGPSWTPTGRLRITINTSSLAEIGAWCPSGGAPDIRFHDGTRWRTSCRASTLDIPASEVGLGPYNGTVFCQRDMACPGTSGEPSWDGYFSPRVTDATLNTRVSTSHFVEVNYDGRDIRSGTFYCWDTWSRGSSSFRRFQVQIVSTDASLPSACYGSTGS